MAPGKESRFCPRARLNPPLMAEYHHAYRVPLRDLSLTGQPSLFVCWLPFALTCLRVGSRMAGNVSGALSGLWPLVKKIVSARALG